MIPALRKPADATLLRHRRRPKYLALAFSFVVFMVIDLIRSGAIATVLTRPIDFMYAQLTEALGDAVVRGLVQYQSAGN
jgi:hypothetical protein